MNTSLNNSHVALDTLDNLVIKHRHPGKNQSASLRKLTHDLSSAANAFNFLVTQLYDDCKIKNSSLEEKKCRQLQQHAKLNQACIQKICASLMHGNTVAK